MITISSTVSAQESSNVFKIRLVPFFETVSTDFQIPNQPTEPTPDLNTDSTDPDTIEGTPFKAPLCGAPSCANGTPIGPHSPPVLRCHPLAAALS